MHVVLLAAARLLEIFRDVDEAVVLDFFLAFFLDFLHVEVDLVVAGVEDFVALPFAAAGDWLGILLQEMQGAALASE